MGEPLALVSMAGMIVEMERLVSAPSVWLTQSMLSLNLPLTL